MGFFSSTSTATKCKECGLEIQDPQKLKRHQEKAHNKTKERCRTCGAEFNYAEALRKHKKKCR